VTLALAGHTAVSMIAVSRKDGARWIGTGRVALFANAICGRLNRGDQIEQDAA
jgi:hypothetical protein